MWTPPQTYIIEQWGYQSTLKILSCAEMWPRPILLIWRDRSGTWSNVQKGEHHHFDNQISSRSQKEDLANKTITTQAVADMIHELADGAQFITTTFRFLAEIYVSFCLVTIRDVALLLCHILLRYWGHISQTCYQAGVAWTCQQILWSEVPEQGDLVFSSLLNGFD